jgi:2-polyprenyl-6-methoxyphenol hydroxylase-like FAD-dependent oxidoreductase
MGGGHRRWNDANLPRLAFHPVKFLGETPVRLFGARVAGSHLPSAAAAAFMRAVGGTEQWNVAERVAVIGAGMAGLFVAMALAPTGREITLYERDPPPPEGGPEAAFDHWNRRRVGHLRHSHGFLARLEGLIAKEHPALLAELIEAGVREVRFADWLPAATLASYAPRPEDEALTAFVSRRTTVELVMRQHVERLPGVRLETDVFVRRPLFERQGGALVAVGLAIEDGAGEREAPADIVVDAGGKASDATEALAEAGVTIEQDDEPCAILYFTRFYRLLPGQDEPPRSAVGSTGDLGYLKFGVFRADHGTFSVTLAAPEVEETLRAAVVKPEVFERICQLLPGVAPWTDPERSEPISRVFGMGDLSSRWREFAPGGKASVLGYFPVGDALVRTNPLYGRGCTFAGVEAHILRDVLAATADPAERLARYSAGVRADLRAFYDDMAAQDRAAAARALNGLDPDYKPSRRSRMAASFIREGLGAAVRGDADLSRLALRSFHMLDPPNAWARRPATLAKAARAWVGGRLARETSQVRVGPKRNELFGRLGLAVRADYARIRAANR